MQYMDGSNSAGRGEAAPHALLNCFQTQHATVHLWRTEAAGKAMQSATLWSAC
jgi:hypothetical protein